MDAREALEVTELMTEHAWDHPTENIGPNDNRCKQAAAVLRRLIPFVEEAEKVGRYMVQHNLEGFNTPLGGICFEGFAAAYRAMKEGK